jgi:hypothetical protein
MEFMQARFAIFGLPFLFNHLRQTAPAWFLHAGLICGNKTFVKPALRASRKIISRHCSGRSDTWEIRLSCSRRNSPSPLRIAYPPPRSPRPELQRAHYIMARRHSKDGAAVRLRQSKP